MGRAHSTSLTGISIPRLAKLIGVTHTRLYQLIRQGHGPRLTPIARSPHSNTHGKPENHILWGDALVWLTDRLNCPWVIRPRLRNRYVEAVTDIKVQRAYARIGHRP